MSDLIFYNGRVITMEKQPGEADAEAVAVSGDKITAVGENAEILKLQNEKTSLIDLQGRTLLPGFNDSHMHLVGQAMTAEKADLRTCASIEEIIDSMRNFIEINEIDKGHWVFGWGWDQSLFSEDIFPTRDDLDRVSLDHPVAITRTCCHVLVANTAALKAAGIDREAITVNGGNIRLDHRGEPNGILEERAMNLVTDLQPPMDKDRLKSLIKAVTKKFLSAGLTSVQTDDLASAGVEWAPFLIDVYQELEKDGELPLRVNLQVLLPEVSLLRSFLDQGYRTGQGGDYFKIGPLKLLTDGSIGGRTAFLTRPYEDSPDNCGVAVLERGEVEELVNLATENGMQCAVHAIGDAAVKMVLEIYREAARLYSRPDPRFRIIHVSMASPEILDCFEQQAVIADVQPSFTPSDYLLVDEHLGPERAAWTYPWKDFADRGIKMGGGSDCPVENYEPLEGIHAAVNRQDRNGNPPGKWHPLQCLNLEEALYIYTMGSAYCTYEEDEKGSIAPGKLADLVVLAEDITLADPARIAAIKVDLTVVGGEVVFCRGE